jgi:ribosomal protein S18 acetylase RimI-like enzyme
MASNSSTAKSDGPILIRPANFVDVPTMGNVAFEGYAGSPLEKFLTPLRPQYPEDARRGWIQRMILRWFDARTVSFVAYPASSPHEILGYAQFIRLGDDEGGKRHIASRQSWLFRLQGWYYAYKFKVVDYFWPDRSVNADNLKRFESWGKVDDARHWEAYPERHNRWHVRSIVVNPEWQGRGIGSKLMGEVTRRADEEGVVIGLEASADGEYLYRKVGFEVLDRFFHDGEPVGDPDTGGIMMWRPDKMKSV